MASSQGFQTEKTDDSIVVYIDTGIDAASFSDFLSFMEDTVLPENPRTIVFDLCDIDQTASVLHGFFAKSSRVRQIRFRNVTSETLRAAELLNFQMVQG